MPFSIICLIYVAGIALLFVELFFPGLVIGIIGSCALVGSITLAFMHYPPVFGISLIVISLILIPSMMVWGLRSITLRDAQRPEDGYTSVKEGMEELLGQEGVTLTQLRPAGTARIGSERVDVTSENVFVEKDTKIKVVKVEGNQVIVRKLKA